MVRHNPHLIFLFLLLNLIHRCSQTHLFLVNSIPWFVITPIFFFLFFFCEIYSMVHHNPHLFFSKFYSMVRHNPHLFFSLSTMKSNTSFLSNPSFFLLISIPWFVINPIFFFFLL